MTSLKKKIGLLKSKLVYDLKPFSHTRLKNFYGQFIKDGDLCFDVGCHTGNRSHAWLALNAKVVAFEPQPYFIKHLKKRFVTANDFKLVAKGVGSEVSTMNLMISSLYPTVSTFSDKWKGLVLSKLPGEVYDEEITVEVTTLDEIIKKEGVPDFCKIDVEGHELEVLNGLGTPITCLSFEFYSEHKEIAFSCLKKLQQLGHYEFNWSIGESLKMQSESWLTDNELQHHITSFKKTNSGDIYARIKMK